MAERAAHTRIQSSTKHTSVKGYQVFEQNLETLKGLKLQKTCLWVCLLMLMTASNVHAHPGHRHVEPQLPTLMDGLQHPIAGIDHVCAMVAIGLWMAQKPGRFNVLIPLGFAALMCAGGLFGRTFTSLLSVNQSFAASLVILGLLFVFAAKLPRSSGFAILSLFALFHGAIHAAELPSNSFPVHYGLGIVITSTVLQVLGVATGQLLQARNQQWVRLGGVALSVIGVAASLR